MIELLRKMFESSPEKCVILLKDKCSNCGREVTVNITPTSGGFGLQGGALFKHLSNGYLTKCTNCFSNQSKDIQVLTCRSVSNKP